MITRYLEASSLFEVGVGQRWGGGIAEYRRPSPGSSGPDRSLSSVDVRPLRRISDPNKSDVKRNTPVERERGDEAAGHEAAFAPLLGLFMEGLSSYHS